MSTVIPRDFATASVRRMARSVPLQHWGASSDEITSVMPGDDLIAAPAVAGTRSITVASDAGLIFDFISQMGFGRAGWYSYDLLDNLGRRSADTVKPEWCVTTDGESVHFEETNRLTMPVFDPHSRQPAYKNCAVRLDPVATLGDSP